MSYKFDIYRCSDCGSVFFDPPLNELQNEKDPKWRCGIMRKWTGNTSQENYQGNGVYVCLGTVQRVAYADTDMFLWFGGW